MLRNVLKYQKGIFFFLTLITGVLIFSCFGNFQYALSQGDHGRDLYAFKRVLDGAVPYRDFSWLFGPLMAYYYALFFKVFGVSVQSVILGQDILIILTGIGLFLACTRFLTPAFSFLCAFWYWALRGDEFFYTYNHSGGLLCQVMMVYALFSYIKTARLRYVIGGLVVAFLFSLIRVNMAMALLVPWCAALAVTDIVRREPALLLRLRVNVYGALLCAGMAFLVYAWYFQGQSAYVLWESFPLSKAQRAEPAVSPWLAMGMALRHYVPFFLTTWVGRVITIACVLSVGGMVFNFLSRRNFGGREKTDSLLAVVFTMILAMAGAHEYLLSSVAYRVYWVFPLLLILIFLIFGLATRHGRWQAFFRRILYIVLWGVAMLTLAGQWRDVAWLKTNGYVFKYGANEVYTRQEAQWFSTVRAACDFIEKNVPPGQKLFTLPFDTLYNYLTGRDQPTRQWVFFEHFHMPPEQDIATIHDLERNKVVWVLVSSRSIDQEPGLGVFGRDYCRVLCDYIDKNYQAQVQFGVWNPAPSWAWNHGVVFFKRKTPFANHAAAK